MVDTPSDNQKPLYESDEEFHRVWDPIFRAAEEGRLPNRLAEVLKVSEQLHRHGYHWKDRPTIDEARAWLAEHAKTCAHEPQ